MLQLFFTNNRTLDGCRIFKIYKFLAPILLGKSLDFSIFMFLDSSYEIIRHSDIERSRITCDNVYPEIIIHTMEKLRDSRQARMTGTEETEVKYQRRLIVILRMENLFLKYLSSSGRRIPWYPKGVLHNQE